MRRAPAPPRRQVPLGGTALDGLDDLDSPFSAGFSWRDLIRRATGIDLGPSKGSAHEDDLRRRTRTGVGGAFPIAVLNFKGGVGKTSVVEALGSTFADVRDDRVIAVDIDAGDLAERHGRRNPLSMADLLADNSITQYSQVRAHTYMNSFGLEVLGLPDYGRTDWRLGRSGVVKAFSVLRKHYSVILVDCVKAINSSVMDAVLPEARALVVVTGASIDAVRKTRTTLDWLGNNGYRRLLGSTVLAVNNVEPGQTRPGGHQGTGSVIGPRRRHRAVAVRPACAGGQRDRPGPVEQPKPARLSRAGRGAGRPGPRPVLTVGPQRRAAVRWPLGSTA